MKKNLLFTGAMALFMASCSQTEFEQFDATSKVEGKGVTFTASISKSADTRAAYEPFENVFNHNWYADKDKIGVVYKKDTKVDVFAGQSATEFYNTGGWMGLTASGESHSFEFKATASGTQGYFVANGDDNTLWLKVPGNTETGYSDSEKPIFRAYWPLEAAGSRVDFAVDGGSKIKFGKYVSGTQTQKTTDGYGIAENAFMVSESDTKSTYDENDNSVAKDRFSLEFKRVNPIIYFKIKTGGSDNPALNREYERDYAEGLFTRFGNLKTVELKAEGSQKQGTTLTTPSKLTFNSNATWDIAVEDIYDPTTAFAAGDAGDAAPKITLTMKDGSGLAWSNDAVAFMQIANVDRSAYRTANEKEKVTATYTFENIQLQTSVDTDKDWAFTGDKSKWVGFPKEAGYNLDNEPYIAYKFAGSDYALEVNPSFEGNLADLFTGNDLKGIKKFDGSAITKSEIKHFVSKVDITAAEDFAVIKSLTGLTNITLLENTTIPAEAFKGLNSLVYLNLPKVTTVANVNAFPVADYTDVYMGSYDFSDKAGTNQTEVRDRLLKASLVKADISAVANIAAGFPTSGVTFTGFSNLQEITVKSGAVVGGAAFKDCAALVKVQFPKGVTGASVNLLEGANSQFMNCEALTTISISNTVIPDMAFNGCTKLATILGSNVKAIVPTAIGESAFKACKAIVDMDLSKAATIGTSAFEDCTALKGNNNLNAARTVLYVNAITHVSDNAFSGCTAIKYISFANATTIGVDILKGTTCTEIEFLKPFTVNSAVATSSSTDFFGTTSSTKLFCAKAQTGVSVNTITLTGNAAGSAAKATTFGNGITKYAE
ncbi:leucine-rich repeat domain-containing protein [uncultured Bacteroides sp.]|uniref:leucine-rich repeat domain-containing protein n=1 Tax=uncultured Bacteroides sp. TaxID=162156 RepID=UPI0025E79180|nr:leucine-rich repeat domain-containing protein [uncultured Bacteroides sp.]